MIPFATIFFGAGEGVPQSAVAVRAKQDFYLVFRRNYPVAISSTRCCSKRSSHYPMRRTIRS